MEVVLRYQPNAMVFNMGSPSIRWVGNKNGVASDPCWYVVDATAKSLYASGTDSFETAAYLPPKCDVPIRDGWFWSTGSENTLKSAQHLEAIWYRSIGLGANLLLNISPSPHGLIDDIERDRVVTFGQSIRDRFAYPFPTSIERVPSGFRPTFAQAVTIDHLWLEESLDLGQHIRQHTIRDGDSGDVIVDGVQTVGSQRVHAFPAQTVSSILVEVDSPVAGLDCVHGYPTGVEQIPMVPVPKSQ